MLEAFVSSRIRRALLEYILTHRADRFYLRGLARTLQLPVSPLRRELKRLQQAGMLGVSQEANILFYAVDTASAAFLQLEQVGQQAKAPSLVAAAAQAPLPLIAVAGPAGSQPDAPRMPDAQEGLTTRIGVSPRILSPAVPSIWRSPLNTPWLVGAAGAGTALILVMAGLVYLDVTSHRLMAKDTRTVVTRKAEVTVVVPPAPASATMHGSRWRITPGNFGGFTSSSSTESF